MSSLRDKIVSGVMWRTIERFGVRLIRFLVTVVLARLLAPEAFGTVALLVIFISISRVFVESGLGVALVQKTKVSQTDYCSVFYLNLWMSVLIYAVLFFSAPYWADFYGDKSLIWLLRTLSLSILFMALNCVQDAVLQREMKFKLSCRIGFVETGVSGLVGCLFAWLGWGAWALVTGTVGGSFCGMLARWFFVKWHPSFLFSWASARSLYGFGWKVFVTSLLNTSAASVYGVVIGKIHSFLDLAYYNRGHSVPSMAMESINGAISSVAFPGLSQVKGDDECFLRVMRGMIRMSSFWVMPLMMGLVVAADSVVLLVFGQRWMPIVPYVQVFAIMFAFFPLSSILFQGLLARGRSDLTLKLEIVKNVLSFAILLSCVKYSPLTLAVMVAMIYAPIGLLLNFWPHRKLSGYGLWMLASDIFVSFSLSMVMLFLVWFGTRSFDIGIWKLVMQISVGAFSYFVLSWIFHVSQLITVTSLFRSHVMRICERIRA